MNSRLRKTAMITLLLVTGISMPARASTPHSDQARTLEHCTETFALSSTGSGVTTIACGDVIVELIGGFGEARPGPWTEHDSADPFQRLVENGHSSIVWLLTNDEAMARWLRSGGLPAIMATRLSFAPCTAVACTGQRTSAAWDTPEGRATLTVSMSQPGGGAPTPSHRHDYVWWAKDRWLWIEHDDSQEQAGAVEFTASGPAAEFFGGTRVPGGGFVQRDLTTVLHIGAPGR